MMEDHAGNLWVGVDDGLYLFKDGRFRRLPEPNHQPLGFSGWDLPKTSMGIFGQSARAMHESCFAFAISRWLKSLLRRKFHRATRSRPILTEGSG